MKAEALLHTQVDSFFKWKAKSGSDILSDVQAKTLVQALHDTLVKMKNELIADTQRKVETKAPWHTS